MNSFKQRISPFIYPAVKISLLRIMMPAILIGCLLISAAASQADSGGGYTNDQCAECHEEMAEDHAAAIHSAIQCLICHRQAADEAHEASPPPPVDCRQCHAPHDEQVAHDAHIRVRCKACHQLDGLVRLDLGSGQVVFSGEAGPGRSLSPHQMVARAGESNCRNCHFKGNELGAAAMVLPAKSILCMPCHVATFSIGDRITFLALLLFALGMGGLITIWFSGGRPRGSGDGASGAYRFLALMRALVAEVLCLKKLYRLSPARWTVHALIYYPILMRLAFGIMALGLSLLLPDTVLTQAMLDKNHPVRALFFDLTGLMILAGAGAALLRFEADRRSVRHLPAPGRGMTALLGLIVLVGFILEGLRIAMTGWPAGAQYAVLGYGISLMVKGMTGITTIYGYLWYGHLALTGVFVAMIPFTRMLHMLTAPVVLVTAARAQIKATH